MNTDLLFSSEKTHYETPPEVYIPLNEKYDFKLDLAANNFNKKCKNFMTKEEDSLKMDWHKYKGWLWLNPPYGKYITPKWVEKCDHEAQEGANIIALLPARTDTLWFHYHIYNRYKIDFIRGRIKFFLDGVRQDAAPFPSMIVTFSKSI